MEEQGRAAQGTERCSGEPAEGRRSSSKPSQSCFSINMRGVGTGEREELFELKDNVGTSINGCKRLQIKGGRREIGRFLCTRRDRRSIGWKRGCGWDRLDSRDQAQGSGPLPKPCL